ncbi:DNA polymerase III subunit chi, partial [Pseudomonas aeruginosa]
APPPPGGRPPAKQERRDDGWRAPANLLLQEVTAAFPPQIEPDLRRPLQARRGRLLGQRNG